MVALTACTQTKTAAPIHAEPWQVVGVYDERHSIMTAGFWDEQTAVTGGVMGEMAYSADGAET
jgi:hypothetical protein